MSAMKRLVPVTILVTATGLAAACGAEEHEAASAAEQTVPPGDLYTVEAAARAAYLQASGAAMPWAEATLSTRLMGSVLEVRVREGDVVRSGDVLVRIDARDLEARSAQVDASIAQAEAVLREAHLHAERMRTLYAKEAAPKAQLDAAETALARAEASVAAARAGSAELDATRAYAQVRAPFAGVITSRFVDPGAFAAPGAPLLTIQDASRLRVSASIAPAAARELRRGDTITARIEGEIAVAVIEGVVPTPGANLYIVNAIVDNAGGAFMAGSAATLAVPQGEQSSIVVPVSALVREGDLTGVHVRTETGAELRWIRLGPVFGDSVEVLSGLRDGERVIVRARPVAGR